MKKTTAVLISAALIAGFGWLVYYGLTHSRGIPVKPEKIERPVITVASIDKDIDLNSGLSDEIWQAIAPKEIKFMYQITVLPWPMPREEVSTVTVKAFHNQRDIYFYLNWADQTEDRILKTNKFSDACAIMFPMDEKAQPHSIMMGFLGKSNIWHWKASSDIQYWMKQLPATEAYADFYYPFEEEEVFSVSKEIPKSAVSDLLAIRVGTITPKEAQDVSGRGFYKDGLWHVVFKRAVKAIDIQDDADFKHGRKLCAFGVWNGSKGDRGGRKIISDWVELDIE